MAQAEKLSLTAHVKLAEFIPFRYYYICSVSIIFFIKQIFREFSEKNRHSRTLFSKVNYRFCLSVFIQKGFCPYEPRALEQFLTAQCLPCPQWLHLNFFRVFKISRHAWILQRASNCKTHSRPNSIPHSSLVNQTSHRLYIPGLWFVSTCHFFIKIT